MTTVVYPVEPPQQGAASLLEEIGFMVRGLFVALSAVVVLNASVASANPSPFSLVRQLGASDGEFGDAFGSGVGLENGVAWVGAPEDGDNGDRSGAVYLFDVATGVEIDKIAPADTVFNDRFGTDIEIDAGTVLITGPGVDVPGAATRGAVFVYDTATRTRRHTLSLNESSATFFGWSADIDGDLAVVSSSAGSSGGVAEVFNVTTGLSVSPRLLPSVQIDLFGDFFGSSVAIEGNTAVVGAYKDDDEGRDAGAAYLFNATTGALITKLTASDAGAGDWFGFSVDIDDGVVLVGAPLDDDLGDNAGAVYAFDAATGAEIGKWYGNDVDRADGFGFTVELEDGLAAARSNGVDETGRTNPAVYLFDPTTGEQFAKLLPEVTEPQVGLGTAIAIEGGTVLANTGSIPDPVSVGLISVYGAPTAPVNGDYNGNGVVDAADYTVWRDRVEGVTQQPADGNGDGLVDGFDYSAWATTFGDVITPPPVSVPVPEPSCASLLTIALTPPAISRRRTSRGTSR